MSAWSKVECLDSIAPSLIEYSYIELDKSLFEMSKCLIVRFLHKASTIYLDPWPYNLQPLKFKSFTISDFNKKKLISLVACIPKPTPHKFNFIMFIDKLLASYSICSIF